ncbi:hypothetical protein CFELI_08105 [Corynebacterium felinum]|uniref:Uncharacterized protein n=1 Tax=Corynebacterium felinum TaxID=131318 RepID=A0ABU2BB66_9CORY|nr:hypothetical protein [Corynebacterium felinum]WJY95227.1 hypothetical protein CFELI_08105 [Corynebacterium felinum]
MLCCCLSTPPPALSAQLNPTEWFLMIEVFSPEKHASNDNPRCWGFGGCNGVTKYAEACSGV